MIGKRILLIALVLLSPFLRAADIKPEDQVLPETKLISLKIELPALAEPIGNYVPAVRSGDLVFLSGTGPILPDGTVITGRLGDDISIEDGYAAARLTAIQHLAMLKKSIGSLNKVKRIVRVFGMVNSDPSFTEQPKVINGYSDLMVEVFGEKGKHARSAVGMASLPMGIPVEIEAIVEVEH